MFRSNSVLDELTFCAKGRRSPRAIQ
jgi:hypothetical protein